MWDFTSMEISIYNIENLVAELENVRNIRRLVFDYVTEDTLPTLCGIIKSMNNLQHLECGTVMILVVIMRSSFVTLGNYARIFMICLYAVP